MRSVLTLHPCKWVAQWSVVLLASCNCSMVLQPALAPDLSETAREEITNILIRATQSQNVVITRRAFAERYILVLEPSSVSTPLGKLASGRNTRVPETFHLLSDGDNCILKQVATNREFRLINAECTLLEN